MSEFEPTKKNNDLFAKYKNKGLSGLCNLGNTCFINSCFQILSHTYEINELLINEDIFFKKMNNKKIDTFLLIEWNEIRKMLWSENCVISPVKFINSIHKVSKIKNVDIFSGDSQNDISEFFIFVIDCFHNSVSRKVNISITGNCENENDELAIKCYKMICDNHSNDYSEFWDIFYGVSVSIIESIESGERMYIIPESYTVLSLPIPQQNYINRPNINNGDDNNGNNNGNIKVVKIITIMDCFDKYVEREVLDGDNAVFNDKTQKKEGIYKYISFWSFPKILVVELKRYTNQNKKNKILVDFPIENLDLSKYVIGYDKSSYIYDLYGVCNHSGGVLGGHYTCYVKNADECWYHFNDTIVSKVENPLDIITPYAYCFFYRKRL